MKFTNAKFLSAKEKERVFRAWCRFLKNRFKRTCFTRALYHHLMQHCGFIAHYDIHGWICEYPTVSALREFFKRNEFGRRVVDDIPEWYTDAKRIAKEVETQLEEMTLLTLGD